MIPVSEKKKQHCFVSAFEGARQIFNEKCYFNLGQLASTSYLTAF